MFGLAPFQYASRTSAELHALLDARKVRAENHIPAPAPRPDPRGGQVVVNRSEVRPASCEYASQALPASFRLSTLAPNVPPPTAAQALDSLNLPTSSSRHPPRGLSPNSQAAWYR